MFCLVAALGAVTASLARAELTASGNLFINFDGDIEPEVLPRDERAPVTVWIAGQVRTLSGEKPPSLREITIGVNRDGHLETRGLPVCRMAQIELASTKEALAACGDALVGEGRYRARSTFPEQADTSIQGKILAFNSKIGGQAVILGHVYSGSPAPSTGIIVFKITHPSGTFGTVLTGSVPENLTRWGYLKRISLSLHRDYTYKGKHLSYLSAPCRAPRDLQKAAFKFAFATMLFDDGRTLSSTLTRTCRVKPGGR
ncbi:MAG: hypothetical protein ABW065_00800 [Solirubrobacterales bacterium]